MSTTGGDTVAWQWKVEIDIESLRRDSERLGREIGSLQEKIDELNTLIDSMRGFWEGDAAEAYIEMM
ncbi:MAG: WXG100 family type VII secretion target, partial [Ruminococcus sp.]|nr:WXG100 family type VII secretion target [Ruminococcus sp.]